MNHLLKATVFDVIHNSVVKDVAEAAVAPVDTGAPDYQHMTLQQIEDKIRCDMLENIREYVNDQLGYESC